MRSLSAVSASTPVPNPARDLEEAVKSAEVPATITCVLTGRVGEGHIGNWSGRGVRANIWQITARIGSEDIILYTRNPSLKPALIMALNGSITVRGLLIGIDQQGRRAFLVAEIAG